MFKRVVLFISIIIGTYIGAGFSSGREISFYLARFGFISVPLTILLFVIFYFLMKKTMFLSYKLEQNKRDFSDAFGAWGLLINLFITSSAIITIAGTISGSRSVANVLFPKATLFIQIIIVLIAFFICVGGLNKIGISNLFVVPVILLFLIVVFVNVFRQGITTDSYIVFCNDYFMALLSFIFYTCSNFFMVGILLLQVGKNYSKNEIKLIAFFSSLIICLFILGYSIMLLFCGKSIINSEMPLISVCFKIKRIMGVMSSITLWFALFTTLISCVFIASNYINKVVKSKSLSVFISIILGYLISFMGFKFVVSYLYALIGVFGIIFLFILFLNKVNFKIFKKRV